MSACQARYNAEAGCFRSEFCNNVVRAEGLGQIFWKCVCHFERFVVFKEVEKANFRRLVPVFRTVPRDTLDQTT